jgi:hypothetical protein
MAYRERTERQERARGSGGLGTPAIELAGLARDLDSALCGLQGTEDD